MTNAAATQTDLFPLLKEMMDNACSQTTLKTFEESVDAVLEVLKREMDSGSHSDQISACLRSYEECLDEISEELWECQRYGLVSPDDLASYLSEVGSYIREEFDLSFSPIGWASVCAKGDTTMEADGCHEEGDSSYEEFAYEDRMTQRAESGWG